MSNTTAVLPKSGGSVYSTLTTNSPNSTDNKQYKTCITNSTLTDVNQEKILTEETVHTVRAHRYSH